MTGLPVQIAELPELVARTREGDERAFATLVEKYQPFVFRWAIALSGDEDEAEDITQEVFVRVHQKLSSFRGDGSLEGSLYRITRRVALRTRQETSRQVASTTQEVYLTDPAHASTASRPSSSFRRSPRRFPCGNAKCSSSATSKGARQPKQPQC